MCEKSAAGRKGLRLKRAVDLLLVLAAAPAWVPLALLVAACVRWRLGSPVLFTQARTGLGGRVFTLVKFRSMAPPTSPALPIGGEEGRVNAFGRWLRATSLDELPELWNVLKGDMSLVGPRPLLPEYLPRYTPEERIRHEVPPGLTGWAQVNGRNRLGWEEKFRLDVWYAKNRSLLLDLKILTVSIPKVLGREDVEFSSPGAASEMFDRSKSGKSDSQHERNS